MIRRESWRRRWHTGRRGVAVVLRDIGAGALELGHNGLALLGLGVVIALTFVVSRPDLRTQSEAWALDWLQERQEARAEQAGDMLPALADADAVERATAVQPSKLTKPQAAVAKWIARRYGVAPEPVGRLVQEAWAIGEKVGLEPTLILAVVAIESRFNPFAQSPMGAQGLMQVIPRFHQDKLDKVSGNSLLDPAANIHVGAMILEEYIRRSGSLEEGLQMYAGAVSDEEGLYAAKVLAEKQRIESVVRRGRQSSV